MTALIIRTTGIEDYVDDTGQAFIKALIMGEASAGKGHPLSTEVLTPDGYRAVGKLQVGDELIGADGHAVALTAIHERGVLPLRRVSFNDGTSVLVDPEHLWQVRDHHGAWQVVATHQLGTLTRKVGASEVLKWEIPRVAPVQHPTATLPLHPYVLGALLGNGHFGDDHVQLTVAFGQEWEDHVEAIEALTPPWMAVPEVTRKRNATARQFHLHECLPILRDLGLDGLRSGAKFIPERYLRADEQQRRDLLAGLMDTDGGIAGWSHYYSTSSRLANDVADLARSLGAYAVVITQVRVDKPTEYNVRIGLDRNPFRYGPKPARWRAPQRLSRRIAGVSNAGHDEVRCLTVAAADQLYVTEHHVVTHNTRSASFWPKPFFADCEQGRMSIADRKVPYVEIDGTEKMWAVLDMLRRECMKPYDKRAYQTLVIDTIDSFQRKVIAERLAAERKDSLSGWADWGYLDAKMTMLVERMLNLPMNIVVNLHIKEKGGGDDDGPTRKEPKLKGDIRDQISNEFDLVGHMSTYWVAENGERTLKRGIKWAPEPTFPILKDRSGQLPPFTPVTFTESDYTGLLDAFRGGLADLTPGEEVGVIELPEGAVAVRSDIVGGPVAPKADGLPRTAAQVKAENVARKAAAKLVPPAGRPGTADAVQVVERGGDKPAAPPAASPEPEEGLATDVATSEVADEEAGEHSTERKMLAEAVAHVASTLGGVEVEPEPAAESAAERALRAAGAPLAVVPPPQSVLICGTAGRNRDGTMNAEPAPGCGGNIREIATTDEDRDKVNIAFMRTRTYLCPACFAAVQVAS